MMPRLSVGAIRIAAALVMFALCATFATLRSCRHARDAAAQAKLETHQTGAAIASGQDAVATLGAAQTNEAAIHQEVEEGKDAIANAPAGDSNDVADRAACGLRSYRDTPRCLVLRDFVAE